MASDQFVIDGICHPYNFSEESMADKQIYGGLCPGGSERLNRIFRLMQTGKVDPTPMTTHEFGFDEIERAFAMMQNKEDGIIKPLIHF